MMSEEKSLNGQQALDKIKSFVGESKVCFFCSDIKTGVPLSVRPMLALEMDVEGNIWFISKRDSEQEEEVESDPFVHLLFQQGEGEGFLNIYGMSEVITDPERTADLWQDSLAPWFDGANDPTIALIKVSPLKGHYWDNVHGETVNI